MITSHIPDTLASKGIIYGFVCRFYLHTYRYKPGKMLLGGLRLIAEFMTA
ncbi:MAG: hypothetical protein Ct9H300mP28_05510 [Pseudomonadota bacterium]|nr:MAG: hypothetical protein Ct9H300mP28_05510 [Pseudomonadota bacterium]